MGEIVRALNNLRGLKYMTYISAPRGEPERELHKLTEEGQLAAASYRREAHFPVQLSGAASHTTHAPFHAPVTNAAFGNSGTREIVTTTNPTGLDGGTFIQALQAFLEALRKVEDG